MSAVCQHPSRRQRGALLIELRVRQWRDGRSLGEGWLRGWESHPRSRANETRLNFILPAANWWSRRVTLPHNPACKAGALLVGHDPIGKPSRCCPWPARFWRPSRTAGARLVRSWCGCREWASQALPVRGPRGNCRYRDVQCTRVDCRAQAPTWQADILLLNHSRRKVKGRQPCLATGPLPFQQRTNTSWSSADANPRFHGGCFGVCGHTSHKAL